MRSDGGRTTNPDTLRKRRGQRGAWGRAETIGVILKGHQALANKARVLVLGALVALAVALGWRRWHVAGLNPSARQALMAVQIPSSALGRFHGTPQVLGALVLPPSDNLPLAAQTVMYHFPGFGAGSRDSRQMARQLAEIEQRHPELSMWHVFIDPSSEGRYTYFTDSPAHGPYETALMTELIPEFERRYLASQKAQRRFLTGHSSGGWVALWLMLRHPDFFAGTWATSPDPADFSDFFGVNITPGSSQNMYLAPDGTPIPAARNGALGYDTLQQYIAADLASNGGDIASYESAFSAASAPKGIPRELFDRASGRLNQETLRQWQQFDLRAMLSKQSSENLAKLRRKIHIWVGAVDEFFLERPTESFCTAARALAIEPECVVVPARGHRDLYQPHPQFFPDGLLSVILAQAAANPSR